MPCCMAAWIIATAGETSGMVVIAVVIIWFRFRTFERVGADEKRDRLPAFLAVQAIRSGLVGKILEKLDGKADKRCE